MNDRAGPWGVVKKHQSVSGFCVGLSILPRDESYGFILDMFSLLTKMFMAFHPRCRAPVQKIASQGTCDLPIGWIEIKFWTLITYLGSKVQFIRGLKFTTTNAVLCCWKTYPNRAPPRDSVSMIFTDIAETPPVLRYCWFYHKLRPFWNHSSNDTKVLFHCVFKSSSIHFQSSLRSNVLIQFPPALIK